MQRSWRITAVVVAVLATAPAASAQTKSPEAARAEKLYDEALTLAEKGNHTEACPKLAESQRLDPALGTEFNLADCYEHLGKTASALLLFRNVERAARAAGKGNLETSARGRAESLSPRAPKLRIVFESAPQSPSLEVDGAPADVGAALAGALPVDPGSHSLKVSAPHRLPWVGSASAAAGSVVDVQVPALAEESAAAIVAAPLPPAVTFTPTRKVAVGVAAAGVVAIGVGAVLGLVAISKKNDAADACENDDPKHCRNQSAVGLWSDAQGPADASTVLFVMGGALVAGGVALWFLGAPSQSHPTVTGRVDANGGSFGLRGVW